MDHDPVPEQLVDSPVNQERLAEMHRRIAERTIRGCYQRLQFDFAVEDGTIQAIQFHATELIR